MLEHASGILGQPAVLDRSGFTPVRWPDEFVFRVGDGTDGEPKRAAGTKERRCLEREASFGVMFLFVASSPFH